MQLPLGSPTQDPFIVFQSNAFISDIPTFQPLQHQRLGAPGVRTIDERCNMNYAVCARINTTKEPQGACGSRHKRSVSRTMTQNREIQLITWQTILRKRREMESALLAQHIDPPQQGPPSFQLLLPLRRKDYPASNGDIHTGTYTRTTTMCSMKIILQLHQQHVR